MCLLIPFIVLRFGVGISAVALLVVRFKDEELAWGGQCCNGQQSFDIANFLRTVKGHYASFGLQQPEQSITRRSVPQCLVNGRLELNTWRCQKWLKAFLSLWYPTSDTLTAVSPARKPDLSRDGKTQSSLDHYLGQSWPDTKCFLNCGFGPKHRAFKSNSSCWTVNGSTAERLSNIDWYKSVPSTPSQARPTGTYKIYSTQLNPRQFHWNYPTKQPYLAWPHQHDAPQFNLILFTKTNLTQQITTLYNRTQYNRSLLGPCNLTQYVTSQRKSRQLPTQGVPTMQWNSN